MAAPPRNRFRKKSSAGSRVATGVVLLFVVLIMALGGYKLFSTTQQKPVETAHHADAGKSSPSTVTSPIIRKPATNLQTRVSTASLPVKKTTKPTPDYAPTVPELAHEKPVIAPGGTARLAIIIDDMGSSIAEARSLSAIKVPLTFAIIPGLRADKEVAAFAQTQHIDTIIHLPMQSKGWPARRLEANGLLVGMAKEEIQEKMNGFIKRFPGAIGANNHMGSEFTEQEEKMTDVMQVLKNNHLFFIDSVTSPASTGASVAQRLGVKTARRTVFLDNEQDKSYIRGQLEQAVRQAKKHGSALAICHPHPATIAVLTSVLPELAGQGVTLIMASQLVK